MIYRYMKRGRIKYFEFYLSLQQKHKAKETKRERESEIKSHYIIQS